jgi:hypothetical protein
MVAGCEKGPFVRWNREVTQLLNLTLPANDIEDMIPAVCRRLPTEVQHLTKSIVQACTEVFLAEGKIPQNVIIAAAFYAWQGHDYKKNHKAKLPAFVKKYQLDKNGSYSARGCMSRSREMLQLLIQLAQELPWVVDQVNATNFHQYIADVAKYHQTLIKDALQPADSEMSNLKAQLRNEEAKLEGQTGKRKAVTEMDLWQTDEVKEQKRKRAELKEKQYEKLSDVLDGYLPPSALNLDSEELNDDDLSQEEVKLYINSDSLEPSESK